MRVSNINTPKFKMSGLKSLTPKLADDKSDLLKRTNNLTPEEKFDIKNIVAYDRVKKFRNQVSHESNLT